MKLKIFILEHPHSPARRLCIYDGQIGEVEIKALIRRVTGLEHAELAHPSPERSSKQ